MTQDDFTEVEWRSLLYGTACVAIAVLLTDKADPVVFLRQAQTAARVLTCDLWRCKPQSYLVRSLIASIEEMDSSDVLWGDDLLFAKTCEMLTGLQTQGNAQEGRFAALRHCNQVASILAAKVPAIEAHDYRMWLLSLARAIAEAVQTQHGTALNKFKALNEIELALRGTSFSDMQPHSIR